MFGNGMFMNVALVAVIAVLANQAYSRFMG